MFVYNRRVFTALTNQCRSRPCPHLRPRPWGAVRSDTVRLLVIIIEKVKVTNTGKSALVDLALHNSKVQ
jgi:hypothetical protein